MKEENEEGASWIEGDEVKVGNSNLDQNKIEGLSWSRCDKVKVSEGVCDETKIEGPGYLELE